MVQESNMSTDATTPYLFCDCSVSTGPTLRAEQQRNRTPTGVELFLISTESRSTLGHTEFPVGSVAWVPTPEVQRLGSETGHSPLSSI
jgi:hypothetical protein